jgi:FlaA1/EpsC-like NDP-sugar epimerase
MIAKWLQARSRRTKKLLLLVADSATLMLIIWAGFCLRFDRLYIPNFEQFLFILAGPAIALPIFITMGLYRAILRYMTGDAIWTILKAVTLSTMAWVSLVYITLSFGPGGIPRTIAAVYWLGSFAALVASRFAVKWLMSERNAGSRAAKRVLIYGAGEPAIELANSLRATAQFEVAAFVSDDPALLNMDVAGLRVYPTKHLQELITRMGIQEVIIASRSASGRAQRDLVASVGRLPVKIRVLPPLADLAAGKYLVSYVRDIDIDDLLGRPPVPAIPELLREPVNGRVIMITGAAGSIGSALCRAVAQLRPAKLVLLDFNELGLYQIERELRPYGSFDLIPVLGSICDADLIRHVINTHEVNTIYHCAAYKHVPMVEANHLEGARNNVLGTLNLVREAAATDVERFVLISSDKAVRPSSVMGATKRWAEIIVRYYGAQAALADPRRVFCCVRFGNVIGSSGSVVPLFKEQIARGGPITLTDEGMTRYFMSIREAAELIIQASSLSESGDILLLEMGDPVRIRDLAEDMVMLAGLTVRNDQNPDGDIEIVTIGMHPAEKLNEELFYDPGNILRTRHPKILRSKQLNLPTENVPQLLEQLQGAMKRYDPDAARSILFRLCGPQGHGDGKGRGKVKRQPRRYSA